MDDTDLQDQGQDDDFDSQDLFEETIAVNSDDEDDPNQMDASHVTTLAESRTRQSERRAVPARVDPGHLVAVTGSVSGRLPSTKGTDRNATNGAQCGAGNDVTDDVRGSSDFSDDDIEARELEQRVKTSFNQARDMSRHSDKGETREIDSDESSRLASWVTQWWRTSVMKFDLPMDAMRRRSDKRVSCEGAFLAGGSVSSGREMQYSRAELAVHDAARHVSERRLMAEDAVGERCSRYASCREDVGNK